MMKEGRQHAGLPFCIGLYDAKEMAHTSQGALCHKMAQGSLGSVCHIAGKRKPGIAQLSRTIL